MFIRFIAIVCQHFVVCRHAGGCQEGEEDGVQQ